MANNIKLQQGPFQQDIAEWYIEELSKLKRAKTVVSMSLCVSVCVHACMCEFVSMYICVYVCLGLRMYVCM